MQQSSIRSGLRRQSLRQVIFFPLFSLGLGFLFSGLLVESGFRVLEARVQSHSFHQGEGGWATPDERWGWRLSKGRFRQKHLEFDVTGDVNELSMNDEPFDPEADISRTRILVLGDSHTQATGVSMMETWAKVLQKELNGLFQPNRFRTYNAGVGGYSLHQYLIRLVDQGPLVKPHYVMLGFTYASDLYDLLPPGRGGWVFYEQLPRTYFDFDENGRLIEKHWAPSTDRSVVSSDTRDVRGAKDTPARRFRRLLEHLAVFRFLRRSNLALTIGAKLRLGGESLWPNMEVVVEKEIAKEHEYNWRLAKALLLKIRDESQKLNAKLIIVGIPYLPQVYDEIWRSTFGGNPRYSRDAACRRLCQWCEENGISYVESLDLFRSQVQRSGKWLHYRRDAHPTSEGQAVIAKAVLDSNLIRPIADLRAQR